MLQEIVLWSCWPWFWFEDQQECVGSHFLYLSDPSVIRDTFLTGCTAPEWWQTEIGRGCGTAVIVFLPQSWKNFPSSKAHSPDSMSITSLAQKSCLLCPYCTVGSHAYLQICSHPSITIHSCIHPHLSLPHSGHSQCYVIPLHDPWAARGQQGLLCFWNSELCPLLTGLLNYLIFSKACVCSP